MFVPAVSHRSVPPISVDVLRQNISVVTREQGIEMDQVALPPISVDVSSSSQPLTRPRTWGSGIFDCFADDETCWWGFWCNCLVAARSAESFDIGYKSFYLVAQTVLIIIGIVVCILLSGEKGGGIGLLALVSGLLYIAFVRSQIRGEIRGKLGYAYPNAYCDDFFKHFCCSCCTVCQEAREAKAYPLPKIDFCFGQPLADLEEAHERAVGRLVDTVSDVLIPPNGSFTSHLSSVSHLSKLLSGLSLGALVIAFCFLCVRQPNGSAIVLLLIFVQPLLILYMFYWRVRRQYASLDMVIKMFFVGKHLTFHIPNPHYLPTKMRKCHYGNRHYRVLDYYSSVHGTRVYFPGGAVDTFPGNTGREYRGSKRYWRRRRRR